MKEFKYFIIFGPPGSGKGIQGKMLAQKFNLAYISSGAMCRNIDRFVKESDIIKTTQERLAAGQFLSDELMSKIVYERLAQPDAVAGFVLDGYPRTLVQNESLVTKINMQFVLAMVLDVADDIVINRIATRLSCICGATYGLVTNAPKVESICDACGLKLFKRSDDKIDVIKSRLALYHASVDPILNFYAQNNILIKVDGTPLPDIIFESLIRQVNRKIESRNKN